MKLSILVEVEEETPGQPHFRIQCAESNNSLLLVGVLAQAQAILTGGAHQAPQEEEPAVVAAPASALDRLKAPFRGAGR